MLKKNTLLSIFVILFFGLFWFLICYYQLPRGDDVLFQFSTGMTYYLDNTEQMLGNQITNFEELIDSVIYIYNVWSGRIIGYLLIPLLSIFGQVFTSLLSSIIFNLIIINVVLLIWNKNNMKQEIFSHPLGILLLNIIIFLLGHYMGYMTMWTFVSIYGVSTLLYLFLLNWTNFLFKKNFNIGLFLIIISNLVGFIAGLTHEVIGAISILMLLVKFYYMVRNTKISIFKVAINYVGLIIGYTICFFAPGNFIRMQSSHDSGIHSMFLEKARRSIFSHIKIILENPYFLGILIFVFLTYLLLKINNNNSIKIIGKNFVFLIGIVFSIFIWSFSSYVPSYGLLFYICLVCIVVFRIYDDCFKITKMVKIINKFTTSITILLILIVFAFNMVWVNDLININNERRNLINFSKEKKVNIPKLPESTNNNFTMNNYSNMQRNFNTKYYRRYYGKHILISN